MKIISLGHDVGKGLVTDVPNIFEYMGYCFHVGTVIFGPWISYEQYFKLCDDESNPIVSCDKFIHHSLIHRYASKISD